MSSGHSGRGSTTGPGGRGGDSEYDPAVGGEAPEAGGGDLAVDTVGGEAPWGDSERDSAGGEVPEAEGGDSEREEDSVVDTAPEAPALS